ncbi:MAG TPA: glycosyltransferase [Longimicrobium sp.]|nr:glycosyltransferase [Longimicrobium sp.]
MIWVILPAYNEADSLPRLLPKLQAALAAYPDGWHVVVVDDGSTDGTAELLEEYQLTYPMSVVTHSINRGLGETERDAFEFVAARCAPDDLVVRLDCDDTHEPEFLERLIDKVAEGFDVVNTSRFQPGGGQKGVTGYRAFISRAANLFMKLIFNIPGLRDYSCGYRAYRGRVLQDAVRVYGNQFLQLRGLGFTSTLETVVKLHLLGCRFAEVPFVLRYDQKASASKMVSSITTLGYLAMAVLYHWPFGGWASQYRGLRKLYRHDRDAALSRFGLRGVRMRTASRISL